MLQNQHVNIVQAHLGEQLHVPLLPPVTLILEKLNLLGLSPDLSLQDTKLLLDQFQLRSNFVELGLELSHTLQVGITVAAKSHVALPRIATWLIFSASSFCAASEAAACTMHSRSYEV